MIIIWRKIIYVIIKIMGECKMESFEDLDLSKLNGVVFSGKDFKKDFKIADKKNGKKMLNKKRNRNKNEPKKSIGQNALFKYFFGLASDCFEKQKDMVERTVGDPEVCIKKIKSKAKDKEIKVKEKILELRKRVSALERKINSAKEKKSKNINIKEAKNLLSKLEDKLVDMQKELKNLQDVSNGNLSFRPTYGTGNNIDYQKFRNGMPNHGENSEKGISQNAWINGRWDNVPASLKEGYNTKSTGEDKDYQQGGRGYR